MFHNKKILITGGTGSIGREIVKQLLEFHPAQIRIFSRDDTKQFELEHELRSPENVRFLIGDVRDLNRLKMAMEDINFVLHAAALKHVSACEYNPFEVVKTNVDGTQNVIEAALEKNVERVINISTDKAINPTNTLGASKLLAERIVAAAHSFRGFRRTIFASVRFGNVLGSRGSVTELFKRQIIKRCPVTITHPDMTRFIMSVPQAVHLALKALCMTQGREVFILKMPVARISDLAEAVMEELAPIYGFKREEIEMKTIGKKAGEKVHEELMTLEESEAALETEEMFIVLPESTQVIGVNDLEDRVYLGARPAEKREYHSKMEKPIVKEQIKILLRETGVLHATV
ncbi:MAG: hypothetical protein A2W61_03145 [Deltaproteobacteria bacterium RIFCSPLOWO2_01_44_7]|nr:MAG: hypothetical protein A2712_02625 [Deltaproteobacteria bacterium RIFCSPHIGHO2_01_FULL_43_49]OGQ16485.1 MAG: hypothetical protein A3D22_00595 [Deltaproteobacteria bacterium RIFCSPHIGHO2_02_FULL_44_53]OGQ29322.1 MAG: hypothetical protein A3D98_04380 [Deltaproteobacteria bacterium RIFCSPHIGHO2_12_FULL_44_21]OGQ33003.1 MAG: hypothetical protein A2979_08525 [Deltaproteobacteria bacterium RIFCSPLOWO2_01_FULL_45_74]OGQ38367.1 MAG: hypothetical protein A2W61_03145 [Deltaproteobacteria bacterium 